MQRQRDNFIDIIKIYACILVVLGHFVQSILKAGIVGDVPFLLWFVETIYYFHVPLFFICSGYLYNKYSVVKTFSQWKNNSVKKLIALGIPYLVFSTVTWGLKNFFASAVNDQTQGYFESIFLNPISPYWYLYALILIFVITPTFFSKKSAIVISLIAVVLKVMTVLSINTGVYAVDIVMQNLFWFVLGMHLHIFDMIEKAKIKTNLTFATMLAFVFIAGSVISYLYEMGFAFIGFLLGLTACISTIIFAVISGDTAVVGVINKTLSKYTMPVFLMHTIFAAGLRSVLLKLSITNGTVHIVLGLIISFLGPVIATVIIERIKYLDFILYPNKYIKIKSRGN